MAALERPAAYPWQAKAVRSFRPRIGVLRSAEPLARRGVEVTGNRTGSADPREEPTDPAGDHGGIINLDRAGGGEDISGAVDSLT